MKKTNCDKCNKDIKNCNYERHYKVCGGIIKKRNKLDLYKNIDDKYECPNCLKLYSKFSIHKHYSNYTKEKLYKKNNFLKNGLVWNKGLTKEDNESIKKQGETYSKNIKNGIIVLKPRKHTDESKKKLSINKIKYLLENPDKVPYLLNHSSKESYPEKLFKEALIENKIEGWIQEYRNGLYSYDFAFIDLKIDVEIDGGTHNSEKVKLIDLRRDNWSKEQGWRVIRFKAQDVKKDINHCIEELKNFLYTGVGNW